MSDARPDTGPPSIAEAFYGKDGPLNGPDPAAAYSIESGKAKPAAEVPGHALFGDRQTRPPTPPSGQTPAAPFNPERYAAPEGGHLDPALMGEFSTAARALGIGQQGGEKLLDLHQRATRAEQEHYAQRLADGVAELERTLPAQDLEAARSFIADPQLTPPELRPWIAQWGSHPLIARLLVNWAGAIRTSRY